MTIGKKKNTHTHNVGKVKQMMLLRLKYKVDNISVLKRCSCFKFIYSFFFFHNVNFDVFIYRLTD